jgi:hypothetical protein
MSPLSLMIRPWVARKALVGLTFVPTGALHALGGSIAGIGPGPEVLRTLVSKSSTSSKIAE